MARTVERVQLNRGSLSASTRRRGLFFVLTVALLYRAVVLWRVSNLPEALGPSVLEPGMLGPFLGRDHTLMSLLTEAWWVGSPVYLFFSALEQSLGLQGQGLLILQALLGVISAGVLYRLSISWLGFSAAVLSGLFFTVTVSSFMGGIMLLPEFMFAWGSLLLLRHLNSVVRHREPSRCLRTGFAVGGLSILSGLGSLWLAFVLIWLPLTSRHFRGRGFADFAWRLALGWFLVISPGLLQGAMVHGSFTPPFANLPYDLAVGIRTSHVVSTAGHELPIDPAWRHEIARHRQQEEGGNQLQLLGRAWGQAPDPIVTGVRRARAFLGGTHDEGSYLHTTGRTALGVQRLPTLPVAWLVALSWLGAVALLGSLQRFAPLYFGVLAPLLVAVGTGVGPQVWMVATPFLSLFAGYGCAQIWLGRRNPMTWIFAPLILGLGYLLTHGV